MKQNEVRDLLRRWAAMMDQRARRAFVAPEVVQKDFRGVWIGLSKDGFRIGLNRGHSPGSVDVLLDSANAPILEDLRRFVNETVKEREDLAVKRELERGEFSGFAAALKRDLAEDAIVGDV